MQSAPSEPIDVNKQLEPTSEITMKKAVVIAGSQTTLGQLNWTQTTSIRINRV